MVRNQLGSASGRAVGDKGTKGGKRPDIILAHDRFHAKIENPSQQSCLGKNSDLIHPPWKLDCGGLQLCFAHCSSGCHSGFY